MLILIAGGGSANPLAENIPIMSSEHSNFTNVSYKFDTIFTGIPRAISAVFGPSDYKIGWFVIVAVFISSPIMAFQAVFGALLSILTCIVLEIPQGVIESGLWGYTSVLSCIATGGFFYYLTPQTYFISLINAIVTCFTHATLSIWLKQDSGQLPLGAFPFVLTTFVFLSFNSKSVWIKRVELKEVTYPEDNLMRWMLEKENGNEQELEATV
ncbi:DgyrCDS7902 [Dimorphilus gyrociliatus]|uniref:DgyrCDS7902 n=1 Tax=Dimorphilus gyrociliatus TaxID=2664684 RepID=A0A7I8VXF2_9ANNE|nr:DgyrCDS7902 [Dimorphilus gyrociliatus]